MTVLIWIKTVELSIWKMTVSIRKMAVSIWDALSLWVVHELLVVTILRILWNRTYIARVSLQP
jgi:hypothetical protein